MIYLGINLRIALLAILALCVISVGLCNVWLDKNAPVATAGKPIEVQILISTDSEVSNFDLGEFIPQGWEITSWTIDNYDKDYVTFESHEQTFLGDNYNMNHWVFKNPVSGTLKLTYNIAPKEVGIYKTISLWIYPTGFNYKEYKINVNEKTVETATLLTGFAINPEPKAEKNSFDQTIISNALVSIQDSLNLIGSISLY